MANFPFQRLQSDLASLIAKTTAGDRLPSEPDLAKKLGVSRATLREAMRTFEAQGLIRRRQGSGTFVVGQVPVMEAGLEEQPAPAVLPLPSPPALGEPAAPGQLGHHGQ